jgi:hypothetical protein
MGINPSCYQSSTPIVHANLKAVASVQWTGTLLIFDISALALDVAQPLEVSFAMPSSLFDARGN